MLSVTLLFLFIAGIAFLGFIINALFDRLKIANVLPLMLIGLLFGPVLNFIGTGSGSTLSSFTPYITAIAVAFILFDVGLNINIFKLNKVITRATGFTFAVAIATGIVIAGIAFYFMHWTMLEAFIFGFALSGPSSIIVPTLVKLTGTPSELRTTLVYESVVTDSVQLIVPLLLLALLISSNVTIGSVVSLVSSAIFGSIVLGIVLAMLLLYLLKRFRDYSKDYSWMLTITMVIATYGIAQALGVNGALTVFVFGILFANVGSNRFKIEKAASNKVRDRLRKIWGDILEDYFSLADVNYVSGYQREIVFFTSTFFFVYIGALFNVSNVTLVLVAIGIAITAAVIVVRRLFTPILREYIPKEKPGHTIMNRIISFDVSRGLSSAIVATLPLAYGIVIPNFLDEIFLVILFTNIASTVGIFFAYRGAAAEAKPQEQSKDSKDSKESKDTKDSKDSKDQPASKDKKADK